jgi:hypothetical protein
VRLPQNLKKLTSRVDQVAAEVANRNDILMASIEIAETDRQTFQTEIRRVWEYLVQFGGNGNSPLADGLRQKNQNLHFFIYQHST